MIRVRFTSRGEQPVTVRAEREGAGYRFHTDDVFDVPSEIRGPVLAALASGAEAGTATDRDGAAWTWAVKRPPTGPTFREWPSIALPAFVSAPGSKWEDHSWHNDASACAVLPLKGGEVLPCGPDKDLMLTCGDNVESLHLWCAEEDPEDREFSDGPRFTLVHSLTGEPGEGDEICESESEVEIAAAVERFLATWKERNP